MHTTVACARNETKGWKNGVSDTVFHLKDEPFLFHLYTQVLIFCYECWDSNAWKQEFIRKG